MDFTEKTLHSELIYDGKIIRVKKDTVSLPDGKQATRELVGHPGGVGVIAVTEQREVLMVRQYRIAAREMMLEIPAGKLEYGEDPKACGIRELEEETGYQAASITYLGQYYATPGYCEEKISLYMAAGLTKTKQNLDDGEFLAVEKIPLDTLYQMVMRNEINDMKTAVAVLKAKELF